MCCDPAARAERMRQRAEYRQMKAEYRAAKRQLKMERKREKMRVKYDVVRSVLGEHKPEQQRQQPALLTQTHTQAQTSNEARAVADGPLAGEAKPVVVARTEEEERNTGAPIGAPPSYERVMRETGTEKKTRNSMAMTERSALPAPTTSSGSSPTRTSSSSSNSTSNDSRGLVGMMRDMVLSQLQTRLDAADDRSRRGQEQSYSCNNCNMRTACGNAQGCGYGYAGRRRQGLLGMVVSGVMEAAQAKSRESRSGGSVKF